MINIKNRGIKHINQVIRVQRTLKCLQKFQKIRKLWKIKLSRFSKIWISIKCKRSFLEKLIILNEESYLNKLVCVLSPDGRNGSLVVQQDVFMHYSRADKNKKFSYQAQGSERKLFLYMIEGEIKVGSYSLKKGDGYGLKQADEISFLLSQNSEFILFDLGA